MPGRGDLQRDALACLAAAVRAVEPEALVARRLADRRLADLFGELNQPRRIAIAAVGKAAPAMARGARAALDEAGLGERFVTGVLITPAAQAADAPSGFDVFAAGHPIPDQAGVDGARAVRRLATDLDADDLLICLISGGGSALMTLPPDTVSLAEVREATDLLLRAGATIHDLNCVRKHLDQLKGGRLAAAAAPARVLALILSDVVGDPLDVIASGPVSPDPTTFDDAVAVLRRFAVWDEVPAAVREHLLAGCAGRAPESPGADDPCFERVDARVVGNNRLAADAACAEARQRGYAATLLTTVLTGEAREVGRVLAALAAEIRRSGHPVAPPACLVVAGETTVTVKGAGRGGRNQEVALGAAVALAGVEGALVASLGTDGVDGPTDAAGAVAWGDTVERAAAAGLDPRRALADNDAYPFFRALDDLIVTGPTGTNVMDVAVVMVGE